MSENNRKIEICIPIGEEVLDEKNNNNNNKIENVNNDHIVVNEEDKNLEKDSKTSKTQNNKQTQKKIEKIDKFKFTPRFFNKNQAQTQTLVYNPDEKVDSKMNTDTTGDDNFNNNRMETQAQTSFQNFLPNQGSSRCNINNPFYKPKLQTSTYNSKSRERFRRRETYRKKRENERKLFMKNKIEKKHSGERTNKNIVKPIEEIKVENVDQIYMPAQTLDLADLIIDQHEKIMDEEVTNMDLKEEPSRHMFDILAEDIFDIDNLTKRVIPLTDELKNDHLSTNINFDVSKIIDNEPFLEIVRNEVKKYIAELKLSDKYLHKNYNPNYYDNVNAKKDVVPESTKHVLFDNENLHMTAKELFPNIVNQRELDEINEIILQNFSYKNKNKNLNENIGDFKTETVELIKVDSGINSFTWPVNMKNENIVEPQPIFEEVHTKELSTMFDDDSDHTQLAMLEKIKQSLKIFQESSEYYNNQIENARKMSVDKKTSSNSLKHLTSEEHIKVTKSDKIFHTSSKKQSRKKMFHSSLQLIYKILQDCSSDDSICENTFNFGNNHKKMLQMEDRLTRLESRVKNIHKMLTRLKKIKTKELDVRKREIKFLETQRKNICENKVIEKYSEKIFDFRKSKRIMDDCFIRRKEIQLEDFTNSNNKDESSAEELKQFGEAYYERRQRNMNLLYYKKSERSILLNHRPVMEFSPPFLNVSKRTSNHKRFSRFIITPSRTKATIPHN